MDRWPLFQTKQGPTRHWPMAHQILNNSFYIMTQSRDNHETVMGKSGDSHETIMRHQSTTLIQLQTLRTCLFLSIPWTYYWVTLMGGHMTMARLTSRPWSKFTCEEKVLFWHLCFHFRKPNLDVHFSKSKFLANFLLLFKVSKAMYLQYDAHFPNLTLLKSDRKGGNCPVELDKVEETETNKLHWPLTTQENGILPKSVKNNFTQIYIPTVSLPVILFDKSLLTHPRYLRIILPSVTNLLTLRVILPLVATMCKTTPGRVKYDVLLQISFF